MKNVLNQIIERNEKNLKELEKLKHETLEIIMRSDKMKIERTGKVIFSFNGHGGRMARVTIPKAYYEVLGITEKDRDIKMTIEIGKITIEKI